MRTILFRGKRIDNGEWVEGSLYDEANNHYILPKIDQTRNAIEFIPVTKKSVGQFAGMLDNNGKKIFEGDKAVIDSELFMCSERGFEGVVTYLECGFYIDNGSEAHRLWSDAYQVKIIGNIHDK